MMFLGETPGDDPSPGMRLLAIATELVTQIKFITIMIAQYNPRRFGQEIAFIKGKTD